MKKILLMSLILLSVTSCMSYTYYEKGYALDFREYIKDPNFTINPTDIGNKDFTPIGIINLEFHVGNKVEKGDKDYVYQVGDWATGKLYYPTFERIISLAVEEAKKMGANGIISFKIEEQWNKSKLPVYIVSGNAVIY